MLTKQGAKLQVPAGGMGDISDVTGTMSPLTAQGTILGALQYMSPE